MSDKRYIFGEHGENIKDNIILQPDDHSCGLRSQQIILRNFGIDIPFEELERLALENGVYSEKGTLDCDLGKVMEMCGVPMHHIHGATVKDLIHELAQGHNLIANVDANELWHNATMQERMHNKLDDWFREALGTQGGNHALVVAGVEVNPEDTSDIKVVLTDPGSGDLRIEYPVNDFMEAIKDSNGHIIATDNPAPYQYDSNTGMFVPSNFAVEQHINQFIAENSWQLSPDRINVPYDYQPAFAGHLPEIGGMTFDEFNPVYGQSFLETDEIHTGLPDLTTPENTFGMANSELPAPDYGNGTEYDAFGTNQTDATFADYTDGGFQPADSGYVAFPATDNVLPTAETLESDTDEEILSDDMSDESDGLDGLI